MLNDANNYQQAKAIILLDKTFYGILSKNKRSSYDLNHTSTSPMLFKLLLFQSASWTAKIDYVLFFTYNPHHNHQAS